MNQILVFLFCNGTVLTLAYIALASVLLFLLLAHLDMIKVKLNRRIMVTSIIPILAIGIFLMTYYSQQGYYYRALYNGHLRKAHNITQYNLTKYWAKNFQVDAGKRIRDFTKDIPYADLLFILDNSIVPTCNKTINYILDSIVRGYDNDWEMLRNIRQCKNISISLSSSIDSLKQAVTNNNLKMLNTQYPNSLMLSIYNRLAINFKSIDSVYVVYKLLNESPILERGHLASQSVMGQVLPLFSLGDETDAGVRVDYEKGLKKLSEPKNFPIADSMLTPFIVSRSVLGFKDRELLRLPRIEIELMVTTSGQYYGTDNNGSADIYDSSVTSLAFKDIMIKYYDLKNPSPLYSISLSSIYPSPNIKQSDGVSRASAIITDLSENLWKAIYEALFKKNYSVLKL